MKRITCIKFLRIMMTAVCCMVISLAGCSEKKPALVLDMNSDGGSFQVKEGDIIEVRLAGNAGTGYSWFLSGSDFFKEERAAVSAGTSQENITGGPVTTVFRIKAAAQGTGVLSFMYIRAWEKEEPAAKVFSAEIKIVPAGK